MKRNKISVRTIDLNAPLKTHEARDYVSECLSFAGDHVGTCELYHLEEFKRDSFIAEVQRSVAFTQGRVQRIRVTVEVLPDEGEAL